MRKPQPVFTTMECKLLDALMARTLKQAGFLKEVGNPDVIDNVRGLIGKGVAVKMAIIDVSIPGRVCAPLAFYYLDERDLWAAVGGDGNAAFASAWDEAVNEARAADVCMALLAKLRSQRP